MNFENTLPFHSGFSNAACGRFYAKNFTFVCFAPFREERASCLEFSQFINNA